MRELPKSTTHVVKKASDIFLPGDRNAGYVYGSNGISKQHQHQQQSTNASSVKVLDNGKAPLAGGIKTSPTTQSLVVPRTELLHSISSTSSEVDDDRGFNVDDISDEMCNSNSCSSGSSSSSSSTSEIEVEPDEEEDPGGSNSGGRMETSVDEGGGCSPRVIVGGKKNGRENGGVTVEKPSLNSPLIVEEEDDLSKIPRLRRQQRDGRQKDDSTRCDEDFTWVNSRGEAPRANFDSDRRSTSHTTIGGRSTRSYAGGHEATPNASGGGGGVMTGAAGKPPRPMTGSLDRRRHLGATRHERDSKSRSTHSLKEKSTSSELQKQDSQSSTLSLNSKGKSSGKRPSGSHVKDDKFWIFEEHQNDSGSYNNYNSSGSSHHNNSGSTNNNSRQSPGIWEPPPPPPISHWDPHYYWNWNHHSREELRLIDYHRRQQEMYRYGSSGALSSTQDLTCASGCCNRNYYPPPPPPPCCSCEHQRPSWGKDCQRQDTDERLRRLQTDKEALALQVKVLTDQVQAQGAKVQELERTLAEKSQLLNNADDLLQRVSEFAKRVGIQIDRQKEMLSRSSLETQKLELMSAMSELKLQQAALERENLELRSSLVNGTPLPNGTLNGGILNSNTLNNNNITASFLRRPTTTMGTNAARMITSTPTTSPLHHGSHGTLPGGGPTSPSLTPPASYRQRVDVHYSSLPRQAFASTLSTTAASGSGSTDANANPKRNVAFGNCLETLESYINALNLEAEAAAAQESAPASLSAIDYPSSSSPSSKNKQPSTNPMMSSSMNALSLSSALNSNLKSMKTTSASAQNIYHKSSTDKNELLIDLDLEHQERATTEPPSGPNDNPESSHADSQVVTGAASTPVLSIQEFHQRSKSQPQPFSSTGQLQIASASTLRGFSVPNLDTETLTSDRTDAGHPSQRSYTPQPSPSPSMSHKNLKGLRNIFGKIKRSNSGTLDDLPMDGTGSGEFKRGGVRATAGARLGWSTEFRKPDKPFREWDLDALCMWFEQMGLGQYEEDLRRWLKVGGAAELAHASPVDIEKELNLKNPLHRKKIVLAVAELADGDEADSLLRNAGKLDTSWIVRWLEDVGLPQHKDSFTAARMDGRMLHKLTMDDLVSLHVTSCLHVASLRRGIQLMREYKWNPECLIRRSANEESNGLKDDLQLWSCQRVMDWLRAVDLSEYAPNLRGTGVHGALMMYEVKFTAELLAELLSIPPSKTLLRRHLVTHFNDLLGRDIIQIKRDAENTLGFTPLTLSAKIKTPKKSQFSLKRKKSSKGLTGDEWSDYVCPMGDSGQEHLPPHLHQQPTMKSPMLARSVAPGAALSSTTGTNSATSAAPAASGSGSHHPANANNNNCNSNVVTTTTTSTPGGKYYSSNSPHASNASYHSSTTSSSSANNNNPNHNNVTTTSNAMMAATMKTHYPDISTISSTSSSHSTTGSTTSGAGSEAVSHQQLQLMSNGGSGSGSGNSGSSQLVGSDSPTSTRSSTTSTS
ncbi:uncharacterized protein LOC129747911 isoform X3 [Uranotaenia lowii]|uniref:uncharacterized protein LOC129747911 isoform X3 n=1 Tax=Uranotaenia lowii TaxID=190385 RepID=UPI00247B1DB8|nr:uncharacterized protein LOC129747911 isoform X3 [Uranotaenia lowii]